jgi:hypothetical protein
LWRIDAERSERNLGSTAPFLSVGSHAIDAAHAIKMHSGAVAQNEPGLSGQFVTAAGAVARGRAGAIPQMPFKYHVAERQPFGIFPRAPSIDLADNSPPLEKIAPPSQIGGGVRRSWEFLVFSL